jgi:hypothetical protein
VAGDAEIRGLIEQVGIPLIHRFMIRRYQLKVCGFISQEFVNALAKKGIEAQVVDSGQHATALVTLPSGTWNVDLSYAQFLCDLNDDAEVAAMMDKIEADPWETIRYSRALAQNGEREAFYHGSDSDDLEELDGNDPGYTGSLGWGLYLTTDPDFARKFGKHVYEVESPVPGELVADIEPDLYDCGNDLTFYTPGSAPFTFEIVDRKTNKTHRYSVLGDCDEQVRDGLRKWALEGFSPSQELNDAGRALPQAAAKHIAQAARAVLEAASESQRVDDVIDTMIDAMAEAGVDDATLDDQVRPLLEALAEEIEKIADEKIAERLGDEIDLSDISATVSEHGYSAFFISGYAPGDEYVIVDTEYLPIPVTK